MGALPPAGAVVLNRQQRLEAVHGRLRTLEEGLAAQSRRPPLPAPKTATRPRVASSSVADHAPRPPLPASAASESAGPAVGFPTLVASHIIRESDEQLEQGIAVTPDRPWAQALILALVRHACCACMRKCVERKAN